MQVIFFWSNLFKIAKDGEIETADIIFLLKK